MRTLLLGVLILGICSLGRADNLLTNGQFKEGSSDQAFDTQNSVGPAIIPEWRCFTVGSATRQVHYEVITDANSDEHHLTVEITANPDGEAGGNVGFDTFYNMLPVKAGERYRLRFKAKLLRPQSCAILAILAGHDASPTAGLVSQAHQIYQLGPSFQEFDFPEWIVPEGAVHMNVVFDAVGYAQAKGEPFKPAGLVIGDIVLEKAN
jgi:hypothetical protein